MTAVMMLIMDHTELQYGCKSRAVASIYRQLSDEKMSCILLDFDGLYGSQLGCRLRASAVDRLAVRLCRYLRWQRVKV